MKKGYQEVGGPSLSAEGLKAEAASTPDPELAESPGGAVAEDDRSGELELLQSEFAALSDRHLRLAAEFTNFRRRAESDLTEAWGRAQADLLRRILDVLDDVQRVSALDLSDEAVSLQTVVDGIDLVERKFLRVLEEASVEGIDPATGDIFDPATMEAVMIVPSPSPEDEDTVDQVFQKGYRFRSHLVRAARVSVRKHE
jgi:molecular chaperone GrpE